MTSWQYKDFTIIYNSKTRLYEVYTLNNEFFGNYKAFDEIIADINQYLNSKDK